MSANTDTNQPPAANPPPPNPKPHHPPLGYRYPVDRLWSGGSYGNLDCWARTDRESNLDGFWLAGSNEWVCGRFDLQITVAGAPLTAEETRFYPGHQETRLVGPGL